MTAIARRHPSTLSRYEILYYILMDGNCRFIDGMSLDTAKRSVGSALHLDEQQVMFGWMRVCSTMTSNRGRPRAMREAASRHSCFQH